MNMLNNIVLIQKKFITFQTIKRQFTIFLKKKISPKNYYKKTIKFQVELLKKNCFKKFKNIKLRKKSLDRRLVKKISSRN